MNNLAILIVSVLVICAISYAQAQDDLAVSQSCASWLQSRSLGGDYSNGFRVGYANGVISSIDHRLFARFRRSQSSLKNAGELVTALDSVCASTPQKRLIDVALHLLGVR